MARERGYSIPTKERENWMLRHESLWDANIDAIRAFMIESGVLSPKLSNWKYVIEGLIQRCRHLKKIANQYSPTPVKPRSELVLTEENYDELMAKREFIDIIVQMKHPVKSMDESGYTYYDYAVYKRRKHKRPVKHVIDEINVFLAGGDINYLHDGRKKYYGANFLESSKIIVRED